MHTIGDAGSSVPAFLGKLWKLVEDPSTNHLISWNANGLSFMIRDQARFARELLPLYYKHNNMASFVRQLNMYGFHKVVSVDSGGLKLDKDEMEFAHMYFLQGQEFLLEHIKRKIPISKQDETKHSKPEVLTRILSEVRGMKGKQETVDSRLNTMKRENEALWREVAALRQKHMKQQQIVNKLIQFLISIVQPSGRAGLGLKRRYPLMLGEASRISAEAIASGKKDSKAMADTKLKDLDESEHSSMPTISLVSSPSTGPVIHDVTDIDETSADMVELPNEEDEIDDTDELKDDSPLISEIFSTDLPIPLGVAVDHLQLNANNMQTELSNEQPDFNTMVEMETAGSSGNNGLLEKAMQGIASPLNPDLLMTVDPLEISNGGSRTESEERRNGKNIRGKSSPKKPDLSVALGEPSIIESREEFDNHLDTMQVDLEQLREVLSMQGSPLDASTLLGVCDSLGLNFEPGLGGVDSFCWPSNPPTTWNLRAFPSDGPSSQSLAALLEQQMLPKLFSTDDSLTSNNYLSFDMDMFRSPSQGAITGNEVIAYNNSLDMVGDELLTTNETDKDTADLFDLLSQPDVASSASPVSSKKRKRN